MAATIIVQSRMGQLQWHPLDPPTYLDYQHAELIFIATHPSDLPEIAGEEVMHDMEEIADEGDVELLSKQDGEHATEQVKEEIFAMLRAREGEGKGKIGADSVITGEWE
jgi:isopentenyl diphosphate isomerase/L-lactate dehydrogenase-like FMN-dependent dehydrogenase